MRRPRTLLAILLSALVPGALVAPASVAASVGASVGASVAGSVAQQEPVVVASDPGGDVRIFTRAHGLSDRQRRTIDARDLTVTPVGQEGSLRFAVTIARITRSERFDQMVFVRLLPPQGSEETWQTEIGFSPQKPDWSYATRSLDDAGHYRNCEPLVAHHRGSTVLRVDVPARCIPPQEARIQVELLTGRFRTDASPFSRDRIAVPGTFDLR